MLSCVIRVLLHVHVYVHVYDLGNMALSTQSSSEWVVDPKTLS